MSERTTTSEERSAFIFLNTLRESGITNMFGATPYLIEELGLSKNVAREMLTLWMANFNEEGNYNTIKM